MQYFFDESGDFVNGQNVSLSLVACLTTGNQTRIDLEKEFTSFLKRTFGNAAEIKGKGIGDLDRLSICELLHDFKSQILITICVSDPKLITYADILRFKQKQVEKMLIDKAEYVASENAQEKYIEEFNRITKIFEKSKKFPGNHFLQFTITYHLLNEALQRTFMSFYEIERQNDFLDFHFHVDRKLKSGLSPYEKFMEKYARIMMWSERAAKTRKPFALPNTWEKGHAFIEKYMTGTRIHYSELLKNVHYVQSHESRSLQIVDVIANTMYRYLSNPKDRVYQMCWNMLADCMGEGKYKARLEYMQLRATNQKEAQKIKW